MKTNRRMKSEVDDFWSILNGSGSEKYTDTDFAAENDGALYWSDAGESFVADFWDRFYWKRATDPHVGTNLTLFGGGILSDYIDKGWSYMIHDAASAIADKPSLLESIFLNTDTQLNDKGIYAVNLYALGVPHTVVVDDFLPVDDYGLVFA